MILSALFGILCGSLVVIAILLLLIANSWHLKANKNLLGNGEKLHGVNKKV
jgi:hypothetical protein